MKILVATATLAFALALPMAHAGQSQSPGMHDNGPDTSMQKGKMGQGMMQQMQAHMQAQKSMDQGK